MSTLNYLGRREEGPHLLMGPIQGCGGSFYTKLEPSYQACPRPSAAALERARAFMGRHATGRSSRPSGGSKFRVPRKKARLDHRLKARSSGLVMVGVGPTRV